MGSNALPDLNLRSNAQCDRTDLGVGLTEVVCLVLSASWVPCLLSYASANSTLSPLSHTHNAPSAQKEKEKKKAKYDSLQDLRKNKKELEFEQKLYKEKEEMLEKEKQLKINRLAQEVCAQSQGCVHCLTSSKGQLGSFSTDECKDRPILPSLEITTDHLPRAV